tara:strand:+ start:1459 stop:1635 length:177 start_codon:yes stop_codon:yes gene_type:complete
LFKLKDSISFLVGLDNYSSMVKVGFDYLMNVLAWGVCLLGAIAFFILWGLANAYPTPL